MSDDTNDDYAYLATDGYVPTTVEIQTGFMYGNQRVLESEDKGWESEHRRRIEFDRWLAAHDAEVVAAALASTPSPAQPTEATLSVGSVKMLRETLCAAQATVARSASDRAQEHSARIGELIAQLDTHRPLGADGKHGDLHTLTCGCDDAIMAPSPVQGADDRLARAEAERRVRESDGLNYDMEVDAFVAGAQWQSQQSPRAALNEVRAGALEDAANAVDAEAPDEPWAGASFESHATWLRARAAELRAATQTGNAEEGDG